jgi:hypothetical protein
MAVEGDADASADSGLFDYIVTRDRFEVPSNLMGHHPEEFFSMLGRIVALSATLEYRVLSFYQALAGRDQDAFTDLSVSRVIKGARQELHRFTDPEEQRMALGYLDEAEAIARRRNDYVHNLWPAQPGGRTFGWRRPQKKGATGTITVEGSLDEMRADLDRIVTFLAVPYQHRVYALVSSGRHLMTPPPAA